MARRPFRPWPVLALGLILSGCGSGALPEPAPAPAAGAPPQPVPAEGEAPLPPPPPAPPAEEPERNLWIEGEPSDEEDAGRSLAEVARAERRRREEAGEPIAVITDESLSEYAVGEITFAEPAAAEAPAAAAEGETAGDSETLAETSEEQIWRSRVLDVRRRWAAASEEIERLEGEVAQLRRRFYDEDDPFYRDSQIKPAWDLALERLVEARAQAEASRAELREVVEEGRQAGAAPGWLREGIELEPEPQTEAGPLTDPEGLGILEPEEPTVVEEDDGGEPR